MSVFTAISKIYKAADRAIELESMLRRKEINEVLDYAIIQMDIRNKPEMKKKYVKLKAEIKSLLKKDWSK